MLSSITTLHYHLTAMFPVVQLTNRPRLIPLNFDLHFSHLLCGLHATISQCSHSFASGTSTKENDSKDISCPEPRSQILKVLSRIHLKISGPQINSSHQYNLASLRFLIMPKQLFGNYFLPATNTICVIGRWGAYGNETFKLIFNFCNFWKLGIN